MAKNRSSKLFQKRKAKLRNHYSRSAPTQDVRARVLIVCEGEKTEPRYFRALIAKFELTTTQVEICGECGSAPEKVVEFGIGKFKMDPDFEHVFFVFDRDNHVNFDRALEMAEDFQNKNRGSTAVCATTSNPCFEFWFLLHFEQSTAPFTRIGTKSPCDEVISRLKGYPGFKDYKKGKNSHLPSLISRLQKAKENAAQVLIQSQQHQSPGQSKHHGNPTTFVHKLVDVLEQLASKQKN